MGNTQGSTVVNTEGLEDLEALGVSQEVLEALADAEDDFYSGLPASRDNCWLV